jgi:Rhodopirellula transposase DDE domain
MPTSNPSVFRHCLRTVSVTNRTAVYGPVRTVVWQGSAGNRCPYADQFVLAKPFANTKKKELLGPFKNAGRTLRPKGKPQEVEVHDWPSRGKGKAIPYGVYDVQGDRAVVNVGISRTSRRKGGGCVQWEINPPRQKSEIS